MQQPPDNLRRCLLGIMQRAITEARSSALAGEGQEAADLLDAVDGIARHLGSWHSGSLDEIRTNLRCFKDAHPGHCTDYPWVLDQQEDLL